MFTILVPLDGSALAEQALPVATHLADTLGARLVVTRVARAAVVPGTGPNDAVGSVTEAEFYLQAIADRLHKNGRVVQTSVPYGEPAARILDDVRVHAVDTVVMATHGRSGLGRVLFGSVAEAVLREANVPVLLVPPGAAQPQTTDRPPRIMVPLDGSRMAEAALDSAREWAVRLNATLVLVQVVVWPPYLLEEMLLNDPDALLADAREYLSRVAGRLRPDAPNVVCRAVLGRPAAATIVRLAGEEHVQMIAMATHGHVGLARLVLGSVATETLRHASTPVLLVRPASLARDQFSKDKRLIDGLVV